MTLPGTSPKAFMYETKSLLWSAPANNTVKLIETEFENFFQLSEIDEQCRPGMRIVRPEINGAHYYPLEKPELCLDFLNTNNNHDFFKCFLIQYGPLFREIDPANLISFSSYSMFYSQVKTISEASNVFMTNMKYAEVKGRHNINLPTPGFNSKDDGRNYLLDKINSFLSMSSVKPYLSNNAAGAIHNGFRPDCLADAIILQLLHLIFNSKRYVRSCLGPNCPKSFIAKRSTGKYCSNQCRQRHYDHKIQMDKERKAQNTTEVEDILSKW